MIAPRKKTFFLEKNNKGKSRAISTKKAGRKNRLRMKQSISH